MKHINSIICIISIIFSFFATTACKERIPDPGFAFSVKSEAVDEGEELPMVVGITRGEHSGYQMGVTIERYDLSTGERAIVEDYVILSGGEPLKEVVDFPDQGRRSFEIVGLPAGTYHIRVQLSRNGYSLVESVATVVYQKDSPGPTPPGPGPEPGEEIPVETLVIQGIALTDGKLVAKTGDEFSYPLAWTPENATLINFSAVSDNESSVVATISSGVLHISAVAAGEAAVTVSVERGPSLSIPVVVKPVDVDVEAFEIEGLELTDGRLLLEDPETRVLPIHWTPLDATRISFSATCSDPSVVEAIVDDGTVVLTSLYPGDATVTVSSESGISQSFNVRVHKTVNVTIQWEESANPTDVQIATKTFPCDLVVLSDSEDAFPEAIVFSLLLEGTVNVDGHDSQTKRVSKDGYFYGNKKWRYDVSSNFLQQCYLIYRVTDYTLNIRMSLGRYSTLDDEFWTINYDEKYKTQDVRIKQYISSFQ